MSEYQYYEFLAVDRPLDPSEMVALRHLSSRAKITPTSFINIYNFGDFKGSPETLLEQYFDAHVYVANWGSQHLLLRLARNIVDKNALASYVIDDVLKFWTTDKHLIIQWLRNEESDDGWVNGEGWMARLLPVREELSQGDYRALYLGWLFGVSVGRVGQDEIEPPVPPGLSSLTAAQRALIEFLGVDQDLLAVAALTSGPALASVDSEHDMAQWVSKLPADEAKPYLLLLLNGNSRKAEQQIKHKYALSLRSSLLGKRTAPAQERRSVAKLQTLAEQSRAERRQREEKKRTRELVKRRQERERYLALLAKDFELHWKLVGELAAQRTSTAYDRACELLVDLSEAASLAQRRNDFLKRLSQFRKSYARQSALLRRLDESRIVSNRDPEKAK
jgi:hypothetical protein